MSKQDDIKQAKQDKVDKLERDKLETIIVYTVNNGMYKTVTTDKDKAFMLWNLLMDDFYTLEQMRIDYNGPQFYYKKSLSVNIQAEKQKVWVDQESAEKAHNAYKALANKEKEAENIPF